MHPEMLRALARARHADLLSEHPTRGWPTVRLGHHPPRFHRSRQRVGSVLIWQAHASSATNGPRSSWLTNSPDNRLSAKGLVHGRRRARRRSDAEPATYRVTRLYLTTT